MRENKAEQNFCLCWEIMAGWNKGKPMDFGEAEIPDLLLQKFKIPNSKNAHCQKEEQAGEISLNFSGWDVAPELFGLRHPAREFPQVPGFSFSLFWMFPLPLGHRGRQGYFLCLPQIHFYFCSCIHPSASTADIAEEKAFLPRHWFESVEYGRSRHLWLLDGISRLWESMFRCGDPEKGKMGRWMLGSSLNYAWRPDGCVRKATGTGSDGLLQIRIQRSS